MDTQPQDDLHLPLLDDPSISRRRFLRGAALAGGGLIAAGLAACTTTTAPTWSYGPEGIPSAAPGAPSPSAEPSGTLLITPAAGATM